MAMGTSPHEPSNRHAPILWVGLGLAASGLLVWLIAARGDGARAGPESAQVARGSPIRSPVAKPVAATGTASVQSGADKPKSSRAAEFEELEFAELSDFDYPVSGSMQVGTASSAGSAPQSPPAPALPALIPAHVRALDGDRVVITGFMNPLEFDGDGVASFALTAIPGGCCFGAIPRLNEWIIVTMPEGKLAEYAYDDPVTIFGTLSVGELYEDDVVLSLFRMTPERIDIGY